MRKGLKTSSRWAWRVVAISAVVGVVGYVALQVGARIAIAKVVDASGLKGVRYEVSEVWPSKVKLTGVSIGEGPATLSVGSVGVEFSLFEVISGKIRSVKVSGVKAVIDATGDTIIIGGLPAFGAKSPAGPTAPPSAKPAGIDLSKLPKQIDISASVVEVRTKAGTMAVPIDATVVQDGQGGAALQGKVSLGADRLEAKGTISKDGVLRATAAGKMSIGALWPLAAAALGEQGKTVEASGTLELNAAVDTGLKLYTIKTSLDAARLRVDKLAAQNVTGDIEAKMSDDAISARVELAGLFSAQGILDGDSKFLMKGQYQESAGKGSLTVLGDGLAVSIQNLSVTQTGVGLSGGCDIEASVHPTERVLGLTTAAGVFLEQPGAVILKAKVVASKPTAGDIQATAAISELAADTKHARILMGDKVIEADGVRANWPGLSIEYSAKGGIVVSGDGAKISADACGFDTIKAGAVSLTASSISGWMRDGKWEAGSPGVKLELARSDISALGVNAKGAALVLNASGLASPGQATMSMLDGSYISLDAAEDSGVTVGKPGTKWAVGPTKLDLIPRVVPTSRPTTMVASDGTTKPATRGSLPISNTPQPLLKYRAGQPTQLALNAVAENLAINASGAKVTAARTVTGLTLGFGGAPDSKVTLVGYVGVSGTDLAYPAADLAIRGISVQLPVALDASQPAQGTFTTESVERAGQELPPITGTLWVTRKQAWLGAEWPVVSEGVVKAQAEIKFLGDKTYADLQAWVPSFGFTKTGELLKILPEGISKLDVTGTFGAKVRYFIDGDQVLRWGEIEVKDATLKSQELDAELIGINGKVWTRNFAPLETAAGQTLSVESARMAKYTVTKGKVDFRIDPGDILFVESASFGFCGGEISARGFRVGYKQNAADLVLYADKIDLGQFAKLVSDGKVDGNGKLYARLPVSVKWPDRLTLGTGYVHSEAGENVISLGGSAADVARLISGSAEKDPNKNFVQERVTAALVNFGFRTLTLELNRQTTGELTATIRLAGKGDVKSDNQVLDITFNINGLEDLITAGLLIKRSGASFGQH